MRRNTRRTAAIIAASVVLAVVLSACGAKESASTSVLDGAVIVEEGAVSSAMSFASSTPTATVASVTKADVTSDGAIDASDLFTERDLTQVADTTNAKLVTLSDGSEVTFSEEGVYVVSGTATDATITVDADDTAKVQIVLDGVTITNESAPAIYVKSADKVFITMAPGSENALSVTGSFVTDDGTNVDAVIFSKDDLTLNGEGSLTVSSSGNGISCKDDLKVTGGTYDISAAHHGLEANDSVRIADGSFLIVADADGIHAENSDDDTLGYVYICGGSLDIQAGSDGIQATTVTQIDGGYLSIVASEGIEGTYVQVNGGEVGIYAYDDGINATTKSYSVGTPTFEIRGGDVSIEMAQGDTDALDANGDLFISGGTVSINAQFAFDFDGVGEMLGGTVYVNGEQVTSIENSMMMGSPQGGPFGMGAEGGWR